MRKTRGLLDEVNVKNIRNEIETFKNTPGNERFISHDLLCGNPTSLLQYRAGVETLTYYRLGTDHS